MQSCSSSKAPIVNVTNFSKVNVLIIILRDKMKSFPYSSVVGSLMYAQVCTRPDITFVISMLCRYLSNPSQSH